MLKRSGFRDLRFAIVIAFWLGLTGCSLFDVKRSQLRPNPEVREVPVEARDTDELKKRLMLLPFLDSDVNCSEKVVLIARKVVLDDLLRTNQFVIVNNDDLKQDVKAFLKDSKEYDLEPLARMASSLGVSAVIEGKILEIRAKRAGDEIGVFRKLRASVDVTIQLRVFAAKNGREILSTVKTATAEAETTRVAQDSASDRYLEEDPVLVTEGVKKAFRSAVPQIIKAVEKLHWEGRVAMIAGDRIYLNAGRLSGIQVGDILKVVEEGEEIFDPETGKFIGSAPGRMKGTVEVVSYFGTDGSIGVIHSGSGFKENDRVELYSSFVLVPFR